MRLVRRADRAVVLQVHHERPAGPSRGDQPVEGVQQHLRRRDRALTGHESPLHIDEHEGLCPAHSPGGSKRPSTAVQPPSTVSTLPVTKLAASEAR